MSTGTVLHRRTAEWLSWVPLPTYPGSGRHRECSSTELSWDPLLPHQTLLERTVVSAAETSARLAYAFSYRVSAGSETSPREKPGMQMKSSGGLVADCASQGEPCSGVWGCLYPQLCCQQAYVCAEELAHVYYWL